MSDGVALATGAGAAGVVAQLQVACFCAPARMSQPESESASAAPAKATMTRMSASWRVNAALSVCSIMEQNGAVRCAKSGGWLTRRSSRPVVPGFHPHQAGPAGQPARHLPRQKAKLVIAAHQCLFQVD